MTLAAILIELSSSGEGNVAQTEAASSEMTIRPEISAQVVANLLLQWRNY